jgi:hypothetical protein
MAATRQEAWEFDEIPTINAHTQDYWVKVGQVLHRLVREAAQASGDKQGASLASDVGANPTQFSEALKQNGPKRFAIEWLPRLIVTDKGARILSLLCALRGMQPKPLPVETPEEKLRRIVARIESKGEMGRSLLREEFGNDADSIVRAVLGEEP